MRIKIWGVRGSIPTPGETTLKYGGNTPCVQVELPESAPGEPAKALIFDGGSGVRVLGNEIVDSLPADSSLEVAFFFTHLHWDHIQGIPFFTPLFRKNTEIHFYGSDPDSLAEVLRLQMRSDHFPISLEEVESTVEFHSLEETPNEFGEVRVKHHFVNHGKEGTVAGFRADSSTGSFIYIPDVEPYEYPVEGADNERLMHEGERRLNEFIRGADVMLFDSMFCNEDYEKFRGWGHSPAEYALKVAADGGVKRLGLFHYAPTRTDEDVDRILEKIKERDAALGVDVFASREGMVLEV